MAGETIRSRNPAGHAGLLNNLVALFTSLAGFVETRIALFTKESKKALATFEKFSPSHKRDYIEWITDAKTDATRDRRVEQAVEWMAEGKPRMWKYMK